MRISSLAVGRRLKKCIGYNYNDHRGGIFMGAAGMILFIPIRKYRKNHC
jgi:hypothetical protein